MTTAVSGVPVRALPCLTGLRFPCALVVFVAHIVVPGDILGPGAFQRTVQGVGILAPAGVSCFFMLSGFVLTWSARPGQTARGFWRKRAVKICPSHAVVWLAALLLLFATGAGATGPPEGAVVEWEPAVTNLFLINSLVPRASFIEGVNGVTWSLTVELFFYLLFPRLLVFVKRIPADRLWTAVGVCVVCVWLVPLPALLVDGPDLAPGVHVPLLQLWCCYFLPPARLPEFLLGMLAARLVHEKRAVAFHLWICVAAAFLALGLSALLLPLPFLFGAATAVPAAALVTAAAMADVTGRRCWLRRPWALFLGRISFAFYLVHLPVILTVRRLLGEQHWPAPHGAVIMVLLFFLAIGCATLLHYGVEQPMMRRLAQRRSDPLSSVPRPD